MINSKRKNKDESASTATGAGVRTAPTGLVSPAVEKPRGRRGKVKANGVGRALGGDVVQKEASGNDAPRGPQLEAEIVGVGSALAQRVGALVESVVGGGAVSGPVALAKALGGGVDKVLASRVLKALRQSDPVVTLYFMPGPEPLRTLAKAAERRGSPRAVVEGVLAAVADYERLIDVQVGDRSLLDSILSAWIPQAREEFELRRKQSAFKAMSQIKGMQADGLGATCLVAPSASGDGTLMDVVWVHGLTGLHRVRPGVTVKLASRRMSAQPSERRATRLGGELISDDAPPLVAEFCSTPTPEVHVHRVKDSLFYTLGGDGFGAGSAVDVVFVEVNRAELKRPMPLTPEQAARGEKARGAYFFAEAPVPSKALQFDLIVHHSLFAGQDPALRIHDTAYDGVADVFDPRRELDRLEMLETVVPLGRGLSRVRPGPGGVGGYQELLRRVMDELGMDGDEFRTYRCAVEYPLYGSQTSMVFPPAV